MPSDVGRESAEMIIGTKLALPVLFLASFVVVPNPSQAASFVDDIWGVVTDPLKLEKGSKELANALDQTLAELRELEQVANRDVGERIEQLRLVVADVITAIDRNAANLKGTVEGALKTVRDIEEKAYRDAVNLIYRGQCVAEVFTSDQLERSLAKLIEEIIAANPGINMLGIRVGGLTVNSVTITDPDQAYRSTKKYYLGKLKTIKESDDAFDILSIYQNIARFARFTRCHYLDLEEGLLFVEEQKDYEIKTSPWINVVRVAL